MVKRVVGNLNTLPPARVVASLATRGKCPMMRVLVAALARLEIDPLVLDHLRVRPGRLVTLGALHVLVFPGQREMRRRVIERLDRLPVVVIVAGLAFGAHLPGVMIFVARQTGWMQSFEGARQVVIHDALPVDRRNVFGIMALFAFQLRVLAEQRIPGLFVIEFLFGGIPLEDAEIFTIVLSVAPRAIVVPFCVVDDTPVHALTRFHQFEDFAMAVEAFQLRVPSKAMTVCTL